MSQLSSNLVQQPRWDPPPNSFRPRVQTTPKRGDSKEGTPADVWMAQRMSPEWRTGSVWWADKGGDCFLRDRANDAFLCSSTSDGPWHFKTVSLTWYEQTSNIRDEPQLHSSARTQISDSGLLMSNLSKFLLKGFFLSDRNLFRITSSGLRAAEKNRLQRDFHVGTYWKRKACFGDTQWRGILSDHLWNCSVTWARP